MLRIRERGRKQYSFDDDGYMQTEWQEHDGDYYYFDANDGHMVKSQWIPRNDGKQYYLTANGTMAKDMAIKDKAAKDTYYYVDEDGVWDGETISYEDVKDRDLKVGYKTGTMNAAPGIHPVEESGLELIISDQSKLVRFKGGEKVFNDEMTKQLWTFAADPNKYLTD